MSPRRLDPDVVRNKLAAIEATRDALRGAGPLDATRLAGDPLLSAAIERLLSRLVDLAVDVNSHVASARLGRAPEDYRQSFDLLVEAGVIDPALAEQLKPSVGMRNAIVHEYLRLDLERVAAAVPLAVSVYGRYVTAVARSVLTEQDRVADRP
jgi:uncharacterized protein YutE (UPF0331/DUF86 family)